MSNFHDLTGQTFNRLKVIGRVPDKRTDTYWLCECKCGNTTTVTSYCLKSGRIKSCGCLRKEGTHGKSNTRLYKIWGNMKSRCYNPNSARFSSYGMRGISVCEEWKNNFQSFYEWAITNGYNDTLSIDRIDVNGNYCPENCRWATSKEQGNNKSDSRFLTYKGKTQTLAQWAEENGIKTTTLHARINYYNWDIEKALTTKQDS